MKKISEVVLLAKQTEVKDLQRVLQQKDTVKIIAVTEKDTVKGKFIGLAVQDEGTVVKKSYRGRCYGHYGQENAKCFYFSYQW